MIKVTAVAFEDSNRIYYFNRNDLQLEEKNVVVVETERGLQLGVIRKVDIEIEKDNVVLPLKNVIRVAKKEDIEQKEKCKLTEKEALEKAIKFASELKLEMKFVSANYTLDKKQLTFNFIADDRVDFRELAKKLASIYKTRIELRQIGVRDKSKEVGGLGPCGRFLCCNTFLNDFNTVSINMAKNQNLSLNPTKINGLCGRLLCCLNYEDDTYTELKKNFPPIGSKFKNKEVEGKVVSQNVLKGTFVIEKSDKTLIEIENESNK